MAATLPLLTALFVATQRCLAATQISVDALATQYSLTTSTSMPFPTATQSSNDTQNLLVSQWGLSRGHIQDGAADVQFVADPFANVSSVISSNSTGPVLQVTYPQGSFSHDTGGAQLYSLWNTSDGSSFESMMVSYELAFDSNFDWVKGGKLPGLRGGPNATGCSGGNLPTGEDCFSTRLMWRKGGSGEVYAYVPRANDLCDQSNIICNSDFGTSISRGSFGFALGQWTRVTMLVRLNNPPDIANGQVAVYFNDFFAMSQENLQFRSSDAITIGGLYFSTFFGGSDDSWATPDTVHSYFRNIRLWGSASPSNLTGQEVKNSASVIQPIGLRRMWPAVAMLLLAAFIL